MKTITMIGQNYCVGINPEKIFSFSIKREDGWISLNINRGEVLIPILYITNAKLRELGYAEFNTNEFWHISSEEFNDLSVISYIGRLFDKSKISYLVDLTDSFLRDLLLTCIDRYHRSIK